MNNEDELIKLAKTRRAMGYSMWPGTCSKCGHSFEAGRHLVEDAKVYSYCNDCYDELEKLVRTGINDVFIQPERSKREDSISQDAIDALNRLTDRKIEELKAEIIREYEMRCSEQSGN